MEIKSEAVNGCDYSRQHLDHKHQTINKQKLKFGMEEILGTIGEDKVNKHTKNNPTTTPTTIVSPSSSVRNIFISTFSLALGKDSFNFENIKKRPQIVNWVRFSDAFVAAKRLATEATNLGVLNGGCWGNFHQFRLMIPRINGIFTLIIVVSFPLMTK